MNPLLTPLQPAIGNSRLALERRRDLNPHEIPPASYLKLPTRLFLSFPTD